MRANSPRSPGCAEDASNCQPPPPPPLLQQAALVFISTVCKNSAWPSSALLSRTRCALRAFACWRLLRLAPTTAGEVHTLNMADKLHRAEAWWTQSCGFPSSPSSPERSGGSLLRAATTGAKLYFIEAALARTVFKRRWMRSRAYVNALCAG